MMNAVLIVAAVGGRASDPAAADWMQAWFDVTKPWEAWWLLLGLAAQAIFVGRWIIQWIASERRRQSVMPILFWWCSLLGASMLLVYYIGRREPIGILGQTVGWIVYSRNLYLIRVKHRRPTEGPQQTAEPSPPAS